MDPVILVLLLVFMVGMLFMSSRARKKQQTQQENLQNSLAVGDVVVMTSGISGTVVDLEDEKTLDLEIAPDVVTTWLRVAVREKLSTPDGAEDLTSTDDTVPEDATPVLDEPIGTRTTADDGVEATPSLRKTGS